jgi:ParB family chromosome partitioning protein
MMSKPRNPVLSPSDGKPTSISIADIIVGRRLRALEQEVVLVLAESMKTISVRRTPQGYELVAGLHRFEAARQLGWPEISAVIAVGSDADACKWQIAENLHRAELTALERAEHIAEWVRLTEKEVSAQVAPKPQGGRPESGIRAAARELGIERTDAQRSIKIASIIPEAKEAARKARIDKIQSKLLAVAAQPPEQQPEKVIELAKRSRRTPDEIAAAKLEQAQRRAAKQASQDSDRRAQAVCDAAVTSMAVLVLELPEPSVRNFVEKAEAAPLARISELVSAMRALRPEQFEGEHEYE